MAGGIYNSAAYLFYSILFIYYAYRLNLASFDQAMDWSREGCEAGRISLILMLMLHRQNLEVMHLYIYIYIYPETLGSWGEGCFLKEWRT